MCAHRLHRDYTRLDCSKKTSMRAIRIPTHADHASASPPSFQIVYRVPANDARAKAHPVLASSAGVNSPTRDAITAARTSKSAMACSPAAAPWTVA